MKRRMLFASLILVLLLSACSNAGNGGNDSGAKNGGSNKGKNDSKETITIAWQPNESSGRDTIGKIIEEATGKKMEHSTTTDFIISIEALTNGSADIAYMGATSYVEAKKKNDNLVPLVVNSGESGTLDDASYYGWLAVRQEDEAQYKEQEAYSINNIAGKRFSFVSNSSTSGFKVPSNAIFRISPSRTPIKD